jgi:PAS domain S-box-containing protein
MEDLSIEELRARLRECQETLEAIRSGEVDAIVMGDDGERQMYTLESADRPYRTLVEQMQEGALTLDTSGTILFANRRAAEILGVVVGQIVGRRLCDLVPDTHVEMVERHLVDSLRAPQRVELSLRQANKTTPVVFSFKSIDGVADEKIVCAVLSDLTQQRQFEARLSQAQKMEAVGQLTGGLAHDFNNLLQAVHGNLELIRRVAADDKIVRWAKNGLGAVDRGAKLTAQLLAFSRSQKLELKSVDVGRLVREMNDLFDRTLGKGINVRINLWPEQIDIVGDATQLELAILNLAINARDAMISGGVLSITSRPLQLVGESDLPDGGYLEVAVSDTGAGMSEETVARAFEPFFTTKAVGSGTGLGLAQVYGICRQAGGQVRIKSELGRGTTVSMLFRQASEHALATEDDMLPLVRSAVHSAPSILVIDDDADVRSFMVDALESLGYVVSQADSGIAGLALLEASVPDLIIIDFAMPHLNGAEVASLIAERNFAVPVIYVSGYAESSALHRASGGNAALLRKPFTISSLADVVASTLAANRPLGSD